MGEVTTQHYILGVDLGQARDHTALVVLEHEGGPSVRNAFMEPHLAVQPNGKPVYHCRHIERLPVGMSYPEQVRRVKQRHFALEELGRVRLVVDQTGVGRAVTDMLKELSPYAVTLTAGASVSEDGFEYRVPKQELIATTQVLLQTGRLKIAKELPEAQTLVNELLAFKQSLNSRGHTRFGNDVGAWREAEHDDLVLATALAAWLGEYRALTRVTIL